MAFKTSPALVAAIFAIAAPAFAQDTAVPSTLPANLDEMTQGAADSLNNAAEATAEAATDAVNAATDAVTDTATAAGEAATDMAGDAAAAADPATETAAPAPAETAEAPATDTPPVSGTPEPQVGAYYVKSTHGDWTVRCVKANIGADPCELYQLLTDGTGNSVAEMTLIPLEGGDVAAGATAVVPLETDLMQGLALKVDSGNPRAYPFNFCAPVGCVSRIGFTAAELSSLKRGNNAVVSLLPFGADPQNPVQLDMSLTGFTAGFDELTQLVADAKEVNAAIAAEQAAAAEAQGEATPEAAPAN